MPEQAGSTMIQVVCVKNGSMLVFVWMYPVKRLTLPPNSFVTRVAVAFIYCNCTDIRCIIRTLLLDNFLTVN